MPAPLLPGPAAVLLSLLYFVAFGTVAVFSLHRIWLLYLLRRHRAPAPAADLPAQLPSVTVQLPLYNERFVVERLLDAVAALDYPRELLEVQVLDDSTDATRTLAAARVQRMRQAGMDVQHVVRPVRTGYKAGALAHGFALARGEFILILDADFLPQPSLIRDLLPSLADPRAGMVQARWTHLNRDQNALTRAQALLLDAHFLLETAARARAGLYINFHGTAGLWRRSAIEQAGGWSADTVTEDLDLSFRAQLAGWRFVYRPDIAVPAELPATLAAFRQQQARWAQGTIAVARKLLRSVLRAPLPVRTRMEAVLHLTCHSIYPATLLIALSALPVMMLRRQAGLTALLWVDVILALSVIVPTRIFYRRAARAAGTRPPGIRALPYLMLTGISLSISNSRAVWQGLFSARAHFIRTPKAGTYVDGAIAYRARTSLMLRSIDGTFAVYLVMAAAIAGAYGLLGAVPAFVFLAWAYGMAAANG